MTVIELYKELDARWPRTLSCSWDNDGLMFCPEPEREVNRVMLALDATRASIAAAAEANCDLLLTHHPMLFRGVKSLSPLDLSGSRIFDAWRGGVSVISLHTRLDVGDGGVNDALAAALGLRVVGKFGDEETPELGRLCETDGETDAQAFASRVRQALGCPAVQLSENHPVHRVAVVGGDGKDFIRAAAAAGADTLITGAASYNTALDAAEDGLNIIEAGHYYTEAPVLENLAKLCRELCGAECLLYDSNLTRTVIAKGKGRLMLWSISLPFLTSASLPS